MQRHGASVQISAQHREARIVHGEVEPAADPEGGIRGAGGVIAGAQGDIADRAAAEALVDLAVSTHGRIDVLVNAWSGLAKRKMFGGVGYVIEGNMAFGIWKHSLVVRCGPERQAECLRERHTSRFDITGRPMKGWLLVGSTATA